VAHRFKFKLIFYYKYLVILFSLFFANENFAQDKPDSIYSFSKDEDVVITIDKPANYHPLKRTIIIFFALPNGNTTAQTMGKTMHPGDDWHFDIQHIRAQTKFIRSKKTENIVVVYLENSLKSWPAWKTKHADYAKRAERIVDTVYHLFLDNSPEIYLNGHSGGGRFIFSYIEGVPFIPPTIKRISFIDSNYGYDSVCLPKLELWLGYDRMCLNVFAYNDSVALYNDKPVVSATGGTWYRSRRMIQDLQTKFPLIKIRDDSLVIYKNKNARIQFFLKTNPDRRIYHTQQVERNGFIHSVLCGTLYDSKGYSYYGERAYGHLIEDTILLK
jgi:hypothetical protein